MSKLRLLNKSVIIDENKIKFKLIYRSFQNKCVTLHLDKYLFLRDYDAQAGTLQPYALRL